MKKTMNLWDIAFGLECEIGQMDFAVAVLNEATHYFEGKAEQKYLPCYADHVLNLLYAGLTLLHDREENLKVVANQLYEKHREEKKHGKVD